LLTSIFLITDSIKYELKLSVDSLPEITIQNIKAGRHNLIDEKVVDELINIRGVEDAISRVWGYYSFNKANVVFSVIGLDEFENRYKDNLKKLNIDKDSTMIVGKGVKEILQKNFYKGYFNFIKPDGELKKVTISGIFNEATKLESNDIIVMSKSSAREIFDIPKSKATDIVLKITNPQEVETIASKIKLRYPSFKVITKNDLKISYQNIFNYKSGLFLAIFIVALFTFFMIIYDRSSIVDDEQKREIGVLKAIGWKVDDIIKEKFYEGFTISILSYLIGVALAFGFVFLLQAPLLKNIFIGYSDLRVAFELPFILDITTLFLMFLLSVPIYIAATIVPSWRVAILQADEAIR
jgi:ABC-type lipoprotein release transport system permease subunit